MNLQIDNCNLSIFGRKICLVHTVPTCSNLTERRSKQGLRSISGLPWQANLQRTIKEDTDLKSRPISLLKNNQMSLHMYFECTRDGLSGRKKNKWISFTLEFSGLRWPQGLSPDKSIADPEQILNRPNQRKMFKRQTPTRPREDTQQTQGHHCGSAFVLDCLWSVRRTVEIIKNTKHVFNFNYLILRQQIVL